MTPDASLLAVPDAPAALFGRDGEPCATCRAPLAGNQRYCLYCGTRRAEARLEFLDVLADDAQRATAAQTLAVAPAYPVALGAAAGAAAAAPPRRPGVNGWLQAHSGILGLCGLLLGTLLVGLLLGHWATGSSSSSSAKAPAPQIIRVAGAAGAGAAAADAGTAAAAGGGAAKTTAKAKSAGGSSVKVVKSLPKNTVDVKSLSSKKAIDEAVKKGKPISTGTGKLPPVDNKPAGGGSSFETIG